MANSLYDDIKNTVDFIVEDYKSKVSDGKVTFPEVFSLLNNAVGTFVKLVEGFSGYTGAEKKAAVLEAISFLFDNVIAPLDIAAIPNIVEPILDNAVKTLVLKVADGMIDSLVNIFNRFGWNTIDEEIGPQDAMKSDAVVIF